MTAWNDRGPNVQARASAPAVQQDVPLNDARGRYEDEGQGRHETIGLTIGLIGDLRRHGLDDAGIADFFDVSPAALAAFSARTAAQAGRPQRVSWHRPGWARRSRG